VIGKTADGYRKDAAGCRENMENEMPLRVRGMQKEEEMTEGKYSIERLEEKIDYIFQNKDLIRQALTHSSYANERKINRIKDYERIEFLGDAVLEMVSSEFLYNSHEEMSEGQLTRRRAAMVCEPSLASCARDLGLDHYILLGKGEEMTGGRARDSIVSDVMEALIGAVYLDGGFEQARAFIRRFVLLDLEDKALFYDAKSILQEEVQKEGKDLRYVLTGESGPEHDKSFFVEVYQGDMLLGKGSGHNKKAAQQQAAYKALLRLKKK